MALPVHSQIINRIAKDALKPLGVQQKGRSRFWYSDEGWYTIFAEFQPFSGRKGSTLNMGIHWLWYPQDHWSFDLGGRAAEFVEYEDDDQFSSAMQELVQIAANNFFDCRKHLSSMDGAYRFALSQRASDYTCDWAYLHRAVLAGLNGDDETARRNLDGVYHNEAKREWEFQRNTFVNEMRATLDSAAPLADWVGEKIAITRKLLKLADGWDRSLPQVVDTISLRN